MVSVADAAYSGPYGVDFLHNHFRVWLRFYDGIVRDEEDGGFFNQLRDDGSVYDRTTRHVLGTCGFTISFAKAFLMYAKMPHKILTEHGIRFLIERHVDAEHGGLYWILNTVDAEQVEVVDDSKSCSAIAFALLALVGAYKAGIENATQHIATLRELAETRYYERLPGLFLDSFTRDFKKPVDYRGQQANLDMCEALIALYDSFKRTDDLTRLTGIAGKICTELPSSMSAYALIYEHYSGPSWMPDSKKNKDVERTSEEYRLRPYGFLPGHSFAWCKVLLRIEAFHIHCETLLAEENRQWMFITAEFLFKTAIENGWDHDLGGVYHALDKQGKVIDDNKHYWALAEMIAAAGMLGQRVSSPFADRNARLRSEYYWSWYDKGWLYAQQHFVDRSRKRAGWYPMLDKLNQRVDEHAAPDHSGAPIKCYPSKTDYYAISLCDDMIRGWKQDRWVIDAKAR